MLSHSQVVSRGVVDSIVNIFIIVLSQHVGGRPGEHDSVVEEELIPDDNINIVMKLDESSKEVPPLFLVEGGELYRLFDDLLVHLSLLVALAVEFTHL